MDMKTKSSTQDKTENRSLRLWPGVSLAIAMLIISYVIPKLIPNAEIIGIFGGLILGLGIIIWWAFFSRAPKIERWIAIILMIVALFIVSQFNHVSLATGGQGMMYFIFGIPLLTFLFVIWAVATKNFSDRLRRISMVLTIILASGWWLLIRTDGITGDFSPDLKWRWSKTAEEELLINHETVTIDPSSLELSINTEPEWPGFRGPGRDGIIKGIQIETDWKSNGPEEIWRKQIGPGCSSFAVNGDLLFTQEQRGEEELVVCYYMKTGEPVWLHADETRFWDSHAGAGPRSTPTLHGGRIYTLGATGILNALDARNGTLTWSRNAIDDADVEHSGWGYSGSPLVINDVVIVAAVGKLVAYDIETGNLRWIGPDGGDSYSSPHLLTIDGMEQVLLMSGKGVTSLNPMNGKVLWTYDLPASSRIVQPAVMDGGEILISIGDVKGLCRINVSQSSGEWSVKEVWTSNQLKPNFNDFVVHKGHAYGFNGPLLVCVNLEEGQRMWRGGRYGGQLILLADQDLLLILSEKGDLAMVQANPERFKELARIKAIEGKTWNHPVMVGDILLLRNTQEMVAYKLSNRAI
jgi:outer membrane protein assembly factor BamB